MRVRRPASLWSEIVDLLFPPRCEVCGADCRNAMCSECLSDIVPIVQPYCRRCNAPLLENTQEAVFCGDCRLQRPKLAAVRSVGLHTGKLREAVLKLKFGGARRLAPVLASLLYDRVLREADEDGGLPAHEIQALVPAVLHPRRRRWRGFDQAELIAERLGKLWGLPVLHAVERVRFTTPQVDLELHHRRENMRGAFQPRPQVKVEGMIVAVVDDVFTTGATLEACAEALRRAGARRVYGLTVTRAVPSWHPAAADQLVHGR
ncbi:MAG: ComF family protein [Armatimonadetes bacterium]|nr:ComF family protein [Armatimonadota bacterium]